MTAPVHTYSADVELASAILRRLVEMMRFDGTERVEIEAAALPVTVRVTTWRAMMPVDRRAVGFDGPRPSVVPDGLTPRPDRPYLVPVDGAHGVVWRDLLDRWNRRPALAPVLGAHGVPSVLTEPDTGRVRAPELLVAMSAQRERVVAPVLLRFVGPPPPDRRHLVECDPGWFARMSVALQARSGVDR